MIETLYTKSVETGQNIYDLSIQEYGDVLAVFIVLDDNPRIDLDTVLVPGQVLKFRHTPYTGGNDIMDHFRVNQVRVNCGDEVPGMPDEYPEVLTDDGFVLTMGDGGGSIYISPPATYPEPAYSEPISTDGTLLQADSFSFFTSDFNLINFN